MILFCLVSMMIVLFRLGYVQLLHGADYRQRSDDNRFRQLTILAPRGIIYDSRGVELAGNRPGYFVAIYDTRSPNQLNVLELLVEILDPAGENPDISVEEFRRRIHQNRYRRWQPVRLIDRPLEFGDPRLVKIEEMRLDLPDVIVEVQPVRSYPQGSVAAHLLGGMGRYTGSWADLQSVWDQGLTGYRIDSIVGRWGLEAAYEFVNTDKSLRGVDGWQWIEVDHLSRPVQELEAIAPTPGNSIHLTIDSELQASIEAWLSEEYVPNILGNIRNRVSESEEIAAVAIDPQTGKILLSVSYPTFDPAELSVRYAELLTDSNRPLENKVVSAFPPGSIFKPATMIAALTEGTNTAQTHRCDGVFTRDGFLGPGGRKLCWVYSYPSLNRSHGVLDLPGALQHSCNVYFYNLGIELYNKMGDSKVLAPIADAASFLGLGIQTTLPELVGFRQDVGILPTPERFRQIQQGVPDRKKDPYPGEVLDITIGQGIQAYTPLQIATFMSMLATGHRYQPYIVDKIMSPEGDIVMRTEPKREASLVRSAGNPEGLIDQNAFSLIQEGLRRVTQVSGGTGASTFRGVPYYTSGKTGTAEVSGALDSHGWFAVWGAESRENEPEIVVSVFVKHGTGGTVAAGPIVRKIMDTYFDLKTQRATP
jgi:penicillin-binding protein 2